MAVNKVIFGGSTILDLTNATASAADIRQGKAAYIANGTLASGTFAGEGAATVTLKSLIEGTISSLSVTGVSSLRMHAFQSRSNLKNVYISNLSSIPPYCFLSCSVESAEFPDVETVSTEAFCNCQALNAVSMPNLISVSERAFKFCPALTIVSFPMASYIGQEAFTACSALSCVMLPNAHDIYGYAFVACYALSYIQLPLSVEIHGAAFDNSPYSHQVTVKFVGSTVGTLASEAFGGSWDYEDASDSDASDSDASDCGSVVFTPADLSNVTLLVPSNMVNDCINTWPAHFASRIVGY